MNPEQWIYTYAGEARRTTDPKLLPLSVQDRIEVLKKDDRLLTDPKRSGVILEETLTYDHDYRARLFERIRVIYNRTVDEIIRGGLAAYSEAAITQKTAIAVAAVGELGRKLISREIDQDTYKREHDEVMRITLLPSPIVN